PHTAESLLPSEILNLSPFEPAKRRSIPSTPHLRLPDTERLHSYDRFPRQAAGPPSDNFQRTYSSLLFVNNYFALPVVRSTKMKRIKIFPPCLYRLGNVFSHSEKRFAVVKSFFP